MAARASRRRPILRSARKCGARGPPIEQQRLDYEAAEKQRSADEEARDLERLKAEARAEVKALESKYNKGTPKSEAPVVQWWEGPKPDKRVVRNPPPDRLSRNAGPPDGRGRGRRHGQTARRGSRQDSSHRRRRAVSRLRRAKVPPRRHWILGEEQPAPGHLGRSRHHRVPVSEERSRWPLLAIFVLSTAINYLDRNTLAVVASEFMREFGLSNEGYGWIVSAFFLSYTLAAPFAGLLVDRVGLRRAATVAVALVVVRRNRDGVHHRDRGTRGLPGGAWIRRSCRDSCGRKGDSPVRDGRRTRARQRDESGGGQSRARRWRRRSL